MNLSDLLDTDSTTDEGTSDTDDEYRPDVDGAGGCAEVWEALQAARNDD
jgi:hypothetical protein